MNETEKTVNEGIELLLSLIFPANQDIMTEEKWNAFARAAEIQAEFDRNRVENNVRSRSVGDVSVTYADAPQNVTVDGHPIAPAALAILKNAGLLCRWV